VVQKPWRRVVLLDSCRLDAWEEFRVSLAFREVAGNPGRGGEMGNLEGEIQSEGGLEAS
jgi:hypothetical protein